MGIEQLISVSDAGRALNYINSLGAPTEDIMERAMDEIRPKLEKIDTKDQSAVTRFVVELTNDFAARLARSISKPSNLSVGTLVNHTTNLTMNMTAYLVMEHEKPGTYLSFYDFLAQHNEA